MRGSSVYRALAMDAQLEESSVQQLCCPIVKGNNSFTGPSLLCLFERLTSDEDPPVQARRYWPADKAIKH